MVTLELELFDIFLEIGNPLCEFIMMVGQFIDGLPDILNSGTIGRRGCIPYCSHLADVRAIKQEMADVFRSATKCSFVRFGSNYSRRYVSNRSVIGSIPYQLRR